MFTQIDVGQASYAASPVGPRPVNTAVLPSDSTDVAAAATSVGTVSNRRRRPTRTSMPSTVADTPIPGWLTKPSTTDDDDRAILALLRVFFERHPRPDHLAGVGIAVDPWRVLDGDDPLGREGRASLR